MCDVRQPQSYHEGVHGARWEQGPTSRRSLGRIQATPRPHKGTSVAEDQRQEVVEEQCWDVAGELYFSSRVTITTNHVINLIPYTDHTATHCRSITEHETNEEIFKEAVGPRDLRS